MKAATQVDLVKAEVPAGQVVDSILEAAADRLNVEPTLQPQDAAGSRSPRRSTRGTSASTFQVRLKPKHSDRSASPSTAQTSAGGSAIVNLEASRLASKLQPVDQGFGAWSYVASAFAMYIVVWGKLRPVRIHSRDPLLTLDVQGFPQAFPIFQTYLSTGHASRFPGSVAIRLLAPGLQDIEEGILFQFLPKATRYRQLLVIVGIFTITISLLLASFATADWQIVLLQGVLFGIGGILMNYVHISIFPEWFDKKKGQAMGIIWTGWRVGALAFPLICQWLLDKHGFAKTLRVLIAPMLALLMPAVVLLRGRYHSATIISKPANPPISKLQALRAPNVLFYLFSACLFYLVVNIPKMFITTFAADIGLKGSDQAVTLSLLVLSDMLGTYGFGWLSDSVFHEGLTASIAVSTSLSHIFGLGFAKSKLGIFFYAVAVGLASGGKL
jgi:hypothetical protein